MQTIIWAFVSMLVALLVLAVLPIGFTFKGKFLITLTSFVVGLAGVAAVSIFPIWQAGLVLLVLTVISAYFIDKRLGKTINLSSSTYEEDFEEELIIESSNKKNNIETLFSETLSIRLEKGNDREDFLTPVLANSEISILENDEDITFLLERESEVAVSEQRENMGPETSNLSEIESLLELELIETENQETIQLLEEQKEAIPGLNESDVILDDSLYGFLNSKKEDTASQDEIFKETDRKKVTV